VNIPPPVLVDARVLWYAVVSPPIKYSGRSYLFVDGKEIGPVPRLVIAKSYGDGGVLLLHCDRRWKVLGIAGGFSSVRDAKKRAERIYPGVTAAWTKTSATAAEAHRYRKALWARQECSFCGRLPYQGVSQLIESRRSRICDICLIELSRTLER
jgi:hypothetical protein